MDTKAERLFTRFEIPVIFLISAFLIGAAVTHDQGIWRIATVALFSASGIALICALYLADKYRNRWN
jgi:hypothetical protein